MYSRYYIAKNHRDVKKLVKACLSTGYCCYDFETNAQPIYNDVFTPTLLSITFQAGSGIAIPLDHFETKEYCDKGYNWKKELKYIGRKLIENKDLKLTKVGWNIKFDNQIWLKYNIIPAGRMLDGMLAKYILNEEKPNGLKEMVTRYLPEFSGYQNENNLDKLPWDKKPLEPLSKYGCLDTDCTFRLMLFFEKKLIDTGLYSLYRNLIMPASLVLTEAEKNGLYLDRTFNEKLLHEYKTNLESAKNKCLDISKVKKYTRKLIESRVNNYIESIEKELEELDYNNPKDKRKIDSRENKISNIKAGIFTTKKELQLIEPLNLGSPTQLKSLLFSDEGFGFPINKYTDKGEPSTDEDTLKELRLTVKKPDSPKAIFLDNLLDYRGVQKMYTTFIEGWHDKVQDDDCLHGQYKIIGTTSGRLSCLSGDSLVLTNLGNFPIKDIGNLLDQGKNFKAMTKEGWKDIYKFIYKGIDEMYEVELEDGTIVKCTLDHKFITNNGTKTLREIYNNYQSIINNIKLLKYDSDNIMFKEVSIKSIRPIGKQDVYDLSIKDCHQFVANGILHHNSSEPNMQQIPKTSVDPNIKKQLISPPGTLYMALDYSQAELRIMAHLSGDETYLTAFREGKDPHLAIAAKKYGVSYEEALEIMESDDHPDKKIWKVRRKQAKQVAFGIIYGIQARLLAVKLSDPKEGIIVTPGEAQKELDEFFILHPKIKKFMKKQEKFLIKHGFVQSLFGRKRRLPQVYSDDGSEAAYAVRLAVNMPCQSAASDMTLFASILNYWDMRQGKFPFLKEVCTVHDAVYYNPIPEDINVWTVHKIWDTCRNPKTKEYFGFEINDVDMSMDFTIGRSMAEELPFIPGYDYRKMLEKDFSVEEYMQEHKKFKGIEIKDFPNLFKEEYELAQKRFINRRIA
jgi:DNA polymerase I-like protein with 3'-5' exonuclease and polymerase domains